MNRSHSTQVTAFSLATLVTLTLMASINQLAVTSPTADTLARAQAPAQVVVVTAKRQPQS